MSPATAKSCVAILAVILSLVVAIIGSPINREIGGFVRLTKKTPPLSSDCVQVQSCLSLDLDLKSQRECLHDHLDALVECIIHETAIGKLPRLSSGPLGRQIKYAISPRDPCEEVRKCTTEPELNWEVCVHQHQADMDECLEEEKDGGGLSGPRIHDA